MPAGTSHRPGETGEQLSQSSGSGICIYRRGEKWWVGQQAEAADSDWCVCLSLCVRVSTVSVLFVCLSRRCLYKTACTKQPLFRRKLEKYREKIAETSTVRSLSPVTVVAEVLRNLAVTAQTLVYNRRTALCRRTTLILLCQTGSGCLFVLCQLSLNLSLIHTRCFVQIFICLSYFCVILSVCLTVIDQIKGTNTVRGFMYNDTVFRDRGAAPMTFVTMQYCPKLTGSQELARDKRGRVWYPLFVFTGFTTRTYKGKGLVVQENSKLLCFWYKTGSHRSYLCFF